MSLAIAFFFGALAMLAALWIFARLTRAVAPAPDAAGQTDTNDCIAAGWIDLAERARELLLARADCLGDTVDARAVDVILAAPGEARIVLRAPTPLENCDEAMESMAALAHPLLPKIQLAQDARALAAAKRAARGGAR